MLHSCIGRNIILDSSPSITVLGFNESVSILSPGYPVYYPPYTNKTWKDSTDLNLDLNVFYEFDVI